MTQSLPNEKVYRNYNVIKGRIGEAIVEQTFLMLGFSIYRYGIEKHLPSIAQALNSKNNKGKVIETIRNQPDFVVFSESSGHHFIEVKFYQKGEIACSDLLKYEHESIIFVLLTKGFIGCISRKEVEDLSKHQKSIIFSTDCCPLVDYKDFKFNASQKLKAQGCVAFTKAFADFSEKEDVMDMIAEEGTKISLAVADFEKEVKTS